MHKNAMQPLKLLVEQLATTTDFQDRLRLLAEVKAYVMQTGPRGGKFYYTRTGYPVYRPLSPKSRKKPHGIKIHKNRELVGNIPADAPTTEPYQNLRRFDNAIRGSIDALDKMQGKYRQAADTLQKTWAQGILHAESQMSNLPSGERFGARANIGRMKTALHKLSKMAPEDSVASARADALVQELLDAHDNLTGRLPKGDHPSFREGIKAWRDARRKMTLGGGSLKAGATETINLLTRQDSSGLVPPEATDKEAQRIKKLADQVRIANMEAEHTSGGPDDFRKSAAALRRTRNSLVKLVTDISKRAPKAEPAQAEPQAEPPASPTGGPADVPKSERDTLPDRPIDIRAQNYRLKGVGVDLVLPELDGTVRQKFWANSIRKSAILDFLAYMTRDKEAEKKIKDFPDAWKITQQALQDVITKRSHAGSWIDSRDEDFAKTVLLVAQDLYREHRKAQKAQRPKETEK